MGKWSVLLGPVLMLAAASAFAQAPARLRGTVLSLDGMALRVASERGDTVVVTLANDVIVSALAASSLSQVRPGVAIGAVADMKSGGVLVAREIHIFPGNLSPGAEGRQTIDAAARTSVVSGTVRELVADAAGGTLTVGDKGADVAIVVPPGIAVVRFGPGSRNLLVPGAHVVIQPDAVSGGRVKASFVIAGENGLVPPL